MLKRLIIPAVLVLTLGCCTKIVQQSGPTDNTEISYQVISGRTKAPLLEKYQTTVPFVSSAWYLPQGKKWDAHKEDAQLYISSAVISHDPTTNKFKAETPYYWPKKGSLTFMAYSPESAKIKITKDGVVVKGWATNGSDKKIDLMVADIAKDKSANGTSYSMVGVPIVFRHILSKVAVTAFIEDGVTGKEIYLNEIIFHNVYGKADFNGSEWTNRGEVHVIDNKLTQAMLGVDKKPIIETMLLIPQSLSAIDGTTRGDVKMEIHYTINGKPEQKTISLNKHGAAWERGKYTEYQIIFGTSDHPIDFEGSVSDWTDYGNTDIVIGG